MPLSLGPIEQNAEFSLNDRSHLTYPVLLGRRFMMDIAVTDISQNYSSPRPEFPGGEPAASAALHGLNLDSTILNFSTHSLPLEEQARFIDLPCVSPDQDTLLQLSAACYEMTGWATSAPTSHSTARWARCCWHSMPAPAWAAR